MVQEKDECPNTASTITPETNRSHSTLRSITPGGNMRIAKLVEDLGIEPCEENEFAWIAEVALRAELPPGWVSRVDEGNDSLIYVNNDTLTTTLVNPLVPCLKQVIESGRMYLENPVASLFEQQRGELWQSHRDELDFWVGPLKDDEGNDYYVNWKEGLSSWHDPRLAKAYMYDLQCLLLNHLQTILDPGSDLAFDNGVPWENEDGAQILTLDGTATMRGTKFRASFSKTLLRIRSGQEDHSQTLSKMSMAAGRLQDTLHAEEQAQRSRLQEKVETRRLRKRVSDAVCESEDDQDNDRQCPRARSKARSSPSKIINQILDELEVESL